VTLLSRGQAVVVAADVVNPYDCHAKAIYTTDMQQLGYVPREAAQDFPLMVSMRLRMCLHTARELDRRHACLFAQAAGRLLE